MAPQFKYKSLVEVKVQQLDSDKEESEGLLSEHCLPIVEEVDADMLFAGGIMPEIPKGHKVNIDLPFRKRFLSKETIGIPS